MVQRTKNAKARQLLAVHMRLLTSDYLRHLEVPQITSLRINLSSVRSETALLVGSLPTFTNYKDGAIQ